MNAINNVFEATMSAKDPYIVRHQRHVTQIDLSLTKNTGLPDVALEKQRIAGTLHDLRKVGVPTEILVKPGRLATQEFSIIKTHPRAG